MEPRKLTLSEREWKEWLEMLLSGKTCRACNIISNFFYFRLKTGSDYQRVGVELRHPDNNDKLEVLHGIARRELEKLTVNKVYGR